MNQIERGSPPGDVDFTLKELEGDLTTWKRKASGAELDACTQYIKELRDATAAWNRLRDEYEAAFNARMGE
jgi:hypothetical protein